MSNTATVFGDDSKTGQEPALHSYFVLILAVAVLIAAAIVAWSLFLRRQISRKTHELYISEERLQLALKGADLALWDWDIKSERIVYNDTWAILLGLDPAKIPPTPDFWESLVHPDDLGNTKSALADHVAGKTPSYEAQYRLKHSSGNWVWVLDRGKVVERDSEGKPSRVAGTHLDITAQKQAVEELREKTEELDMYFSSSLDLYCILDKNGYFRRINSLWESVLGYPAGELENGNIKELIHPDDLIAAKSSFEAMESGRPVQDFVNRCRCRDGTWRNLEWRACSAGDRVFASARDITERLKDEQEKERLAGRLMQVNKMEAIGRLAGGVAHDFNNLLTAIKGNIELAMLRLNEEDPVWSYLRDAEKASDSAERIARQLLAFSRKQLIEPRIVNLNEVVESIRSVLVRIIGDDIRIRLSLAPDLGPVRIDPTQYEQVLLNLAANSRDAMPGGGEFTIATENVILDSGYCADHSWAAEGRYILLSVSDTGSGIPREIMNNVFEPFFTTKKGRGTGMGLAMVYGIVKHGGGNIDVFSEPGKGTNIRIYIPRVEGKPEKLERGEPAGEIIPGRETILLVEDEEMVMKLVTRMLRQLGYVVLQAATGEDAIDVVKEYRDGIDMLLTDLVLPGIDGQELSRRLVAMKPGMKVLFTSGYTDDLIANRGVIDEGVNFLPKPFTPQVIAMKIREVLGKKGSP